MAKKSHQPTSEHIVTAAMKLAAERGWRDLPLADIAERAGVSLAEVVEDFPNRAAILDAYGRHVDRRMLAGGHAGGESPRDRLFDAVMRRFETMAPDRRAISAILRQCGGDPLALACGVRRFMRSMALTLEAAGIASAGLSGLAKTQTLAAIYLNTLRTFLGDDSPDLSRTMAVLDRALGRAESLAGIMLQRGTRPVSEVSPGRGET
ncbi:MAG: TetR family transcriptional regulator [Magnetospirillum sp.]|nr:TetR family transcriptional regulator [Magnetospirillum sp.]